MRFSVGLPTHRVDLGEEMVSPEAIADIALAAERAGFDAVFVTDHPAPGDAWLAHGGHHTLDPFVALAFAGAATSTLRLHTNLLVLAYRNPFVTAKSVATLDVLSRGRVILGIGAGYLEPEFAALGVPFEERNERTDEALGVIKAAWTGRSVSGGGPRFEAPGNTALPRPVQHPHPPIWVGGNSRRAIRRAVELADGWAPMPNPARGAARRRTPALESLDDLAERVGYAHAHAEQIGRLAPLEIVFMPLGADMFSNSFPSPDAVVESVTALAALGVTYLTTAVPGESRTEVVENIARYGEEVLPRVAGIG